ncbi:MAG: transcription termination/antitermination NusG family protein [Pseudomonadota bacterium]|nr:transcription termination/antitermination NusG family protein [Pseudomonadota bacterium]
MWIVAQTKVRQEKKAENNLKNQGFNCYLPVIITKKYAKNIWVKTQEVLFSRYIFIKFADYQHNISKINNTFGISKLLVNHETLTPYTIKDNYIDQIKSKINTNNPIEINNLQKGDKIKITKGALSNLTGIFLEKCGNLRSKLFLSFLNQKCSIVVDNTDIKRHF